MNLNIKQIIASVTGAVLAALALSFLGAGGTILGVAVGSAAATIGTAVAFHSLDRGHKGVQRLITKDEATGVYVPPSAATPPRASDASIGVMPTSEHGISVNPAPPMPAPTSGAGRPVGRHWSLAAAIALTFGISLGAVTVIELVIGESFSDVVGQRDSAAKTSIGGLFTGTTTTTTTTTSSTSTTRPATSTTRASTTTTRRPTTTTTAPTTTSTSTTTTTAP